MAECNSETNAESKPIRLDYAPPEKRRIVKWYWVQLGAIVGLFLVMKATGPAMRYVGAWREWRALERCMRYSAPMGRVVYEDEPAELGRLLGMGKEYHDGAASWSREPAEKYAMHVPAEWKAFQPYSLIQGMAFLHGRTSPAGNERLVAVQLSRTTHAADRFSLWFTADVYRPGSWRTGVGPPTRSNTLLSMSLNAGDRVRVMAGQRDAADGSHFAIDYVLNGKRGTIDGWLKDDDSVVLTPRGNPPRTGVFWQPGTATTMPAIPAMPTTSDTKEEVDEGPATRPTGRLKGVVVDGEGKSAAGAGVELHPWGHNQVRSDAEGRFRISWAEAEWQYGPVRLVARDVERKLAGVLDVKGEEGEVRVVMEPAVEVSGRVVGPEGAGIAGAEAYIRIYGSSMRGRRTSYWSILEPTARTDGEGRYVLHAVPRGQRYSISVTHPEFTDGEREFTVQGDGPSAIEVEAFRLEAAEEWVWGSVVDETGKPMAGAFVSCYGHGQPGRFTTTDEVGRYSIKGLIKGPVSIVASAGSREVGRVEANAPEGNVRIVNGKATTREAK